MPSPIGPSIPDSTQHAPVRHQPPVRQQPPVRPQPPAKKTKPAEGEIPDFIIHERVRELGLPKTSQPSPPATLGPFPMLGQTAPANDPHAPADEHNIEFKA